MITLIAIGNTVHDFELSLAPLFAAAYITQLQNVPTYEGTVS